MFTATKLSQNLIKPAATFYRNINTTRCLCAKKKKNPKLAMVRYRTYQQEPYSERTSVQKLLNMGKKLIPFDKNLEVTGKNTGPSVEGGSKLAQKLAAKHVVPPVGYYNKYGKYIVVKERRPNFVVPDLNGFELQPYVPYKTLEVNQTKFTVEDLYMDQYIDDIEEDMAKIELGTPLEEVISERMSIIEAAEEAKQAKQLTETSEAS